MISCLSSMVVLSVTLLPAVSTAAECHDQVVTNYVNGYVQTQVTQVCDGTTTQQTTYQPPPVDSGLDAICVSTALSAGEDPYTFCGIPPEQQIVITPTTIAAALARVHPPVLLAQVQPSNGRTLVNFDTNFYVEPEPFETTLTLLGQRVELQLVPAQFTWRFGDGEVVTTDRPGAPYPQLDVTHRYLRKGSVSASVDTTWTATYRVNGGPSAPVPGTLTVPGPPVDLTVVTATPTLVG